MRIEQGSGKLLAWMMGMLLALASTADFAQVPRVQAELPSGDGQPIGFTGYVKDSESGLYYAGARYYDPAIGRFLTQDPVSGGPMNPPSLHRYLYAYANPTTYTDSTGRQVDINDPELVARNLGLNEEQTAAAIAAHIGAEDFRNGVITGAGKEVVRSAYGVAKWGARVLAKTFLDVGDAKGIVDPLVNGVANVAGAIQRGPNGLVEYEARKSVESDELLRQGRTVEAGELYGPEVATAMGGAATMGARAGAFGSLARAPSAIEGVVTEGAGGEFVLRPMLASAAGDPGIAPANTTVGMESPGRAIRSRIDELRAAIPENSRGRITMASAVVEDSAGKQTVLIGTSEPRGYLRRGVELKPGERLVAGPGHAEADILSHAMANDLKVISIGATRPICAECQEVIVPTAAEIVTPLKKPER